MHFECVPFFCLIMLFARFCFSLIAMLLCIYAHGVYAQSWRPDILGGNYEQKEILLPDDYSGKVKAVAVRQKSSIASDKAVLYVHGYNDYFFQYELGNNFANNGYNFYAVDLRKYGRSLMVGQTPFEVRDIKEYFEDINAILDIILSEGNKSVVLMGHSTGGLIASYYLAVEDTRKYPITALILNSPFLDMNLDAVTEDFVLPVVSLCGAIFPSVTISQGGGNQYARTLLKKYGGEWDYNTQWKFEWPQSVSFGWLAAITRAQDILHQGADIAVPILLLHSDKSAIEGTATDEEAGNADIVLDVAEISCYGRRIGNDITEYVVKNGMHDLFLSRIPVRYSLYSHVFEWLRERGL